MRVGSSVISVKDVEGVQQVWTHVLNGVHFLRVAWMAAQSEEYQLAWWRKTTGPESNHAALSTATDRSPAADRVAFRDIRFLGLVRTVG